jgi:hypothetical protein
MKKTRAGRGFFRGLRKGYCFFVFSPKNFSRRR